MFSSAMLTCYRRLTFKRHRNKKLKRFYSFQLYTFNPACRQVSPQLTILLKRTDQVVGYHLCRASLNLVALYHMYQLAVLK